MKTLLMVSALLLSSSALASTDTYIPKCKIPMDSLRDARSVAPEVVSTMYRGKEGAVIIGMFFMTIAIPFDYTRLTAVSAYWDYTDEVSLKFFDLGGCDIGITGEIGRKDFQSILNAIDNPKG